jgi:homoserine acetyltransferase
LTYAAWRHVPATYILCEEDRALKPDKQELLIQLSEGRFDVVRCTAGHSPFLSQPEWLGKAVRKIVGEDIET